MYVEEHGSKINTLPPIIMGNSEKWVPPIVVIFKLQPFSTSMIVGERVSGLISEIWRLGKSYTLPKFNIASEKWWLEDDSFLLGFGHFSGAFPVILQGGIIGKLGVDSLLGL